MLTKCSECKREVSDQAASCPHCGHPIASHTAQAVATTPRKKRSPVFLALAVIAFVLALLTPRILLVIPMIALLSFSAVSLFRKERGSGFAVVTLVLGFGLLWLNSQDDIFSPSSTSADDLSAISIVDWNWSADPSFAGDGAIKWNVQVRNMSAKNVAAVQVQLTTYDQSGRLVSTDSTYINAIPVGDTRSVDGYADYYGTEKKANVQVIYVRYAD